VVFVAFFCELGYNPHKQTEGVFLMQKPMILLSGTNTPDAYVAAVEAAGGVPDYQYCPVYSEEYDGLLLTGGADIEPARYGQPVNGSVAMDAARDEAEWRLIDAFLQAGKPIFGICRGCQVLNVYFGGTLHQDIPTKAQHRLDPKLPYLIHNVVASDPLLEGLYGAEFVINSCHHQAVDKLGEGLRITARCPEDQVVEGFAHETLPVFAVQWHPEKLSGNWLRQDAVNGIGLFEYFIRLCREGM
jgi:putative glutamine amidotransferase